MSIRETLEHRMARKDWARAGFLEMRKSPFWMTCVSVAFAGCYALFSNQPDHEMMMLRTLSPQPYAFNCRRRRTESPMRCCRPEGAQGRPAGVPSAGRKAVIPDILRP